MKTDPSDSSSSSSNLQRLSVDEVRRQEGCTHLAQLLAASAPRRIPMHVWSAALDSMLPLSKRSGTPEENLVAAVQMLQLAGKQLWRFNAWTLTAYIRCAAAFKGALQPAGLAAWQKALLATRQQSLKHKQHHHLQKGQRLQCPIEEPSPQEVGNIMLSLGTLAAADAQLAAAVDRPLAQQLLEQAAHLAQAGDGGFATAFTEQTATNVLYGAALLGLQPERGQLQALLAPVQAAVSSLTSKGVTQLLLAFQRFSVRAQGLRGQQSRADVVSKLHPYHLYYPGDALLAAVLEHACQLNRRRSLGVQAAGQALGACGDLGYLPSPHIVQELLEVLAEEPLLTAKEVSAGLMGCARLGVLPEPELIGAFLQALVSDSGRNLQALANSAWALAVLEACDPEMWQHLTTVMSGSPAEATDLALRQWHQAYLLMKLRHGGGVECPTELLRRSLAVHRAECQKQARPKTHFERAVAQAVRLLANDYGVDRDEVEIEYPVPDPDGEGWVRVDVAIPTLRLVVEADGPVHFLRNIQPLHQTGDTLARNRLLRGWDVIVVPYSVFAKLIEQDPSHRRIVTGLREFL